MIKPIFKIEKVKRKAAISKDKKLLFGRSPIVLDQYIQTANANIKQWRADLKRKPSLPAKEKDKIRNKIAA